jgi:predicted TIM-barrel fold metal-dependent hydrolase
VRRAIDLAVNVDMGRLGRPAWLEEAGRTLGKGDDWYRDIEPDELIALLDAHRIEKAVLGVDALAPSPHVLRFPEKHPGRFHLGAAVDPRSVLRGVRALEALARSLPVVEARLVPFQTDVAPDAAVCYPLYAKCAELGLPVAVYTGIPLPPLPSDVQDPLRLDRVCFHFPELSVVMAHGADPWWDVAIRLLLKYRNLYLQTSAWSPRRLPAELLHFMQTRGAHKVLWASNHPTIAIPRALAELAELPLRADVLDAFVYGNAARVFFRAGSA